MQPADDLPREQLVGKRVTFRDDEAHRECWHHRVGLKGGKVLRPARSLAQKAEMLAGEGLTLPEGVSEVVEVPRVWVFADPCPSFPHGCETAVEPACLWLEFTSAEQTHD